MFLARTPQNLTYTRRPMPSDVRGVVHTLRLMRSIVHEYKAHPAIRQAAISILFLAPQKDDYQEVNTLFEYVRDDIRYVRDIHNIETLQTPDKTMEIGAGDCDDKVTLLCALLEAVGYPTQFIVAGYTSENAYEHVYCLTAIKGVPVALDATEPYPMGYTPPGAVALACE
jgi:transglutaminase-like putative cysteine protease